MNIAETWPLLKETGTRFWRNKGPRLGAALAFYSTLSMSPLLLVVVAIAGAAFGEQAARGELAHQIRDTVGDDGARAIQGLLAAHATPARGILMTLLGVATLVLGASGIFGQLQDALDTIWEVRIDQTPVGIRTMIRDRIAAFSVVCGLGFLLLVSLVLTAMFSGLHDWLDEHLAFGGWSLQAANQLVSFAVTTLFFAFIFKVLPHAWPSWSDVWVGALVTAGFFSFGKFLIGLYLGRAAPGSAYGAAGSFVVLLIWIYYSAQIMLLGAEFTHLYSRQHGTGRVRDLREPPSLVGAEPVPAPDR